MPQLPWRLIWVRLARTMVRLCLLLLLPLEWLVSFCEGKVASVYKQLELREMGKQEEKPRAGKKKYKDQ